MITKNHATAYAELYRRAEKVLTDYGTKFANKTINNIDEYFACLSILATLERDHPEEIDPIFTMLPATEATFEIDANTRNIKVPDDFRLNGVAVQGDEIAEIIYFSIDRYFDAVDLATKDIIIQWKHEKDAITTQNFSATYKKSLTLIPGKIVFGWPLSSDITEKAGNVQFSVRFYDRQGEGENATLVYSFSTSTAVIKIVGGLDFDLSDDAIRLAEMNSKNEQIYNNLREHASIPGGSLTYNLAKPEFTGYYYYTIVNGEPSENATQTSVSSLSYDLPVQFAVKASVPADDDGLIAAPITYNWFYSEDPAHKPVSELTTQGTISEKYVRTYKSEGYNPNEFYYINRGTADAPVWEVYSTPNDPDNNPFNNIDPNTDKEVELYLLRSICTPNIAGYFIAEASNLYTFNESEDTKSAAWLVPFAQEPTYIYEYTDHNLLLGENGTKDITITAEISDGGELNYQWYFSTKNVIDQLNPAIPVGEAGSTTITADREGYYYLKATNSKNNSMSKNYSDPISTSYAPSIPSIVAYRVDGASASTAGAIVVFGLNKTLEVEVDINNMAHTGDITYQWNTYTNINGEDIYTEIPGATSRSYVASAGGSYVCKVTNTYNQHPATVISNQFVVQNTAV